MCLAIPALVVALGAEGMATVSAAGIERQVSLALVDDVAPGDYVLLHVGYALHKIDTEQAEATLRMMAEAGLLGEVRAEMGVEP